MKKFLAFLLIFAMLLPLAACGEKPAEPAPAPAEPTVTEPAPAEPAPAEPAPAEPTTTEPEPAEPAEPVSENIPVDRETAWQALLQVALAYYNKNPYCQYEAKSMTPETKYLGPMRCTQFDPPEYASADQWDYTQCGGHIARLYQQAFGYDFMEGAKAPPAMDMPKQEKGPQLIYYRDDVTAANVNEVVAEYRSLLQPGDIIDTFGETGHVMMYLGDYKGDGINYVTHCWGAQVDLNDGLDAIEYDGSIKIQTEDDLLFGKHVSGPNWDLYNVVKHSSVFVAIIRPFEAEDFKFEITPATASRLKYPEMVIDRYADRTQYNDVQTGEDMTMTVSVTNKSTEAYKDLHIVENLPEGVTLKDGKTEWTVDVPAGETVKCTYTVTVTSPRGSTILVPGGMVDNIPTREIEFQVGGKHLTQEQKDEATKLSMGYIPEKLKAPGFTDLQFANDFYKEVYGIELGLPATINDYIGIRFKKVNSLGLEIKMLQPRDVSTIAAENKFLTDMEVREHLEGYYVTLGMDIHVRATEVQENHYQPGDIIITMMEPNTNMLLQKSAANIYIYLGENKVAMQDPDKGLKISTVNNTIGRCVMHSLFVTLRPSLAWDDLNNK